MERWGMIQLAFDENINGNPFTDYDIYGTFTNEYETKNAESFYDHTRPWITHCSIQRHKVFMINEYREQYHKPVVLKKRMKDNL